MNEFIIEFAEQRLDDLRRRLDTARLPPTLAYALAHSPAGMAAWLVEKYHAWSDWELLRCTTSATA